MLDERGRGVRVPGWHCGAGCTSTGAASSRQGNSWPAMHRLAMRNLAMRSKQDRSATYLHQLASDAAAAPLGCNRKLGDVRVQACGR